MKRLPKIIKLCFCITSAFMTVTFTQGQSVDEIINKHIDAIGGKEILSQINFMHMIITSQIEGSNMRSVITIMDGIGFKSVADFNGQKIIECITDKGGWRINPMAGETKATPLTEKQYKASKLQIYINPFLNYASRGHKVEFLGTENANNATAYKIKLTTQDNAEAIYLIDASTYYVAKAMVTGEVNGQPLSITSSLSNYQKTDFGFMSPFTVKATIGDHFSITSNVTEIEINKPVDPSIFDIPE